jgi:hypothetical protein
LVAPDAVPDPVAPDVPAVGMPPRLAPALTALVKLDLDEPLQAVTANATTSSSPNAVRARTPMCSAGEDVTRPR